MSDLIIEKIRLRKRKNLKSFARFTTDAQRSVLHHINGNPLTFYGWLHRDFLFGNMQQRLVSDGDCQANE